MVSINEQGRFRYGYTFNEDGAFITAMGAYVVLIINLKRHTRFSQVKRNKTKNWNNKHKNDYWQWWTEYGVDAHWRS
jgi:choline-glycine betaine transporter